MKKIIIAYFAVLAWTSVSANPIIEQNTEMNWKAGAAAVDITPDLPMWMAGYGSRDRPGDEIAQRIHTKALAVRDAESNTAVIVTVDILGVPRIVREAVEKEVETNHGILPSHLLINASHTHSGPEVRAIETLFEQEDPERTRMVTRYRENLKEKIVNAVEEALLRMEPAELSYARSSAGFAMNRREDYSLPEGDDRTGYRPNMDGPVDHDVPVLQVTGVDGSLIAILFGYASHATTIGGYAFHGDYAGFAQHYLEESNPGAVALFMAGAGGDQNPHPRRDMVGGLNGLDLAKMHGRTLSLAVEAARNAHPHPIEPRLESILENVYLEYLPAPDRQKLQREAESANTTVRENAQVLLEWLDRDGQLPTHYPYPVQIMRFGNQLTLVALASEVVVDYSLRLKNELSDPHVWVAGYSNDFLGYIPSYRIWIEGGYEGGESMTYSRSTLYRGAAHPNIWAPKVEDKIISKVHELHGRIRGKLQRVTNE